jgi:hypothetical protein
MSRASAALMGASTGITIESSRPTLEPVYELLYDPFLARMFENRKTRLEQMFGTDVREP